MKSIKNVFVWCRRYISITLLLVIAFILFVLFFNENSIVKSIEYDHAIDSLRTEISTTQDTFLYYQQLNKRLNTTDPQIVEQVAREQYHMNCTNEDVYIFE